MAGPVRESESGSVGGASLHRNFSGSTALERTFYTLVPSLEFAERCYDIAKFGEIPEEFWVDCVVSLECGRVLSPAGTHILTCFVQYVPYHLREGNWDENRELAGRSRGQENRRIRPQCAECNRGAAGAHAARSGAHLRADRRKHFSRRLATGATLLHASRAGMVAVPHSGRWTLFVWRGRASRRRRDRSARDTMRPIRLCATGKRDDCKEAAA